MVVLCKGTGSVDEVFKLAGFNVVSVDWVHAFTTGKVEKDPADILLDLTALDRFFQSPRYRPWYCSKACATFVPQK